jgi:hypothetical protein
LTLASAVVTISTCRAAGPQGGRMWAFIHIGLMKTGTTSIQMTLLRNAARLAERGICYPTSSANHWSGLLPFLKQSHFRPVDNFSCDGEGRVKTSGAVHEIFGVRSSVRQLWDSR